jgi:1-acyl-sn-glycerol-3-phosphate acyltransferase
MFYSLLRIITYIFVKLFFRFEAFGLENIPKDGPAIIAINHSSYIDPFIGAVAIEKKVNFIAKEELFCNPIMRFFIKKLNGFPVKQDYPDIKALKKAVNILNNGGILLIFPEGTRSFDGKLLEPKIGIGLIAYRSKAPVIPAYIKGANRVLPRGSKIIKLKKCSILYGKPIDLTQYYNSAKNKNVYKAISNEIMKEIGKLGYMSNNI